MKEKKEERIFDKPTQKQVKQVLDKVKKAVQKKEEQASDKMDILLEKVEGLVKRQDRLEQIYTKGVVTSTANPKSEKKTTDQEKQSSN